MPVFSIVIPTFNRAEKVSRALKSVLNQSFSDFEVLVMDDGSTDNTAEVVEKFSDSRIKYEWGKNFGGPAAPRNRGWKLAQGKYIAFLDSDDWWVSTKLEESLKVLDQGFDLVYHDLYIVKKNDQKYFFKKVHSRKFKSPVFNDLLNYGNGIFNSSVVVRKDKLDAVGGLSEDPDFIASEDFDLWLRIAKVTDKFKWIPKTLGYYWMGGGNISSKHQSIRSFTALERLYADDIEKLGHHEGIYWMNYHKGMCCYLLGDYAEASKYLKRVYNNNAPMSLLVEIFWKNFLIKIRQPK